MPYTPDNLIIDPWSSPVTISGTDLIRNLDEAVNTIISTDANSIKNHVNTQLEKIPPYLSSEFNKIYTGVETNATIATTKALEASASATTASSSETIATTKAAEALASANNAATQAGIAATYASNALTSENNAITAAQAAGVSADEVGTWTIASPFSVANIGDLSAIDTNKYKTAIVKNIDTGGVFIYDSTKSTINNGGTIFNGWVRQYSGAVSVKWFGAKGDGVTDDKNAFKLLFNSATSYTDIYIPSGTYNVTVGVSDLTDITSTDRDYAFLLIDNKQNINISGQGTILFNAQETNERAWFIVARNSSGIAIDGLRLVGTLDLVAEQVSVNLNEYGIMFYNSFGCKLINSFTRQLVVPVSVTGEPTSPATTANLSQENIILGNYFKLFQQCSTFGAGASDLIITNNIFEDMYTGFKISRNPLNGVSTIDISKNILISNNIFKWNETMQIGLVDYQPVNTYSLVGIEIQAPTNNIVVSSNIIDMSYVPNTTSSMITESAPIILFNSSLISDSSYVPKNISILGNTLYGYKYRTYVSIFGSPLVNELAISNNNMVGGIRLTSSPYSYLGTICKISNNIAKSHTNNAVFFSFDTVKLKQLIVNDNAFTTIDGVLNSGYASLIFFGNSEITKVIVKDNVMELGGIISSVGTTFTCNELTVSNNVASAVDLIPTSAKNITISDNRLRTNATAIKLTLDAGTKASCLVSVINNATYGISADGVATILNLNGGKLKVNNNGFTSSNSQFVFDSSVVIYEGHYFGSGAPTQNAFMGVRYSNYGAGADGNYIKTSFTTNVGWSKIAVV